MRTIKRKGGTTVSVNVENNALSVWGRLLGILILLLASFFGGAFVQKKNTPGPVELPPVYIKGDTVTVYVDVPKPVYVKKPADTANIIMDCIKEGKYSEIFPVKKEDSLVYVPTSKDTLAIVKDWATQRTYEETILDNDTLGFAKVTASVRYNKIDSISAIVVPAIKKIPYEVPPKKVSPFVAVGVTTQPSYVFEGGLIFNGKWGGAFMYQKDITQKKNAYGLMVVRKF